MGVRVSVIMPVYNAEAYIFRAIQSILNQTYSSFELILIDDCGNDKSMLVANQFRDERIRIIYNDMNRGIAYSRNIGLQNSNGEYIALMDDDDLAMPERFREQVKYLDGHPEIDIVGGRARWIDKNDKPISPISEAPMDKNYIRAKFLLNNVYWNCEVMFRKKIIDKYQYFYKEGMYGMEDYDFWIHYSKICNMSNIDKLVLLHRETETNETTRINRQYSKEKEIVFNCLRRESMQISNIQISAPALEIINKYFNYLDNGVCHNIQDLLSVYCALDELQMAVQKQKAEYSDEMKKICKEYYLKLVQRSNMLWWAT